MNKGFKILLIVGVIILLAISTFLIGQMGKPTEYYINKAIQKADTSVCDEIPVIRIHSATLSAGFLGGSRMKIYNARKYCKREALTIHPTSSGIYRFTYEDDMKKYYSAVRTKNHSGCTQMKSEAATLYCFEAFIDMGDSSVCKPLSEFEASTYSDSADFYYQSCLSRIER